MKNVHVQRYNTVLKPQWDAFISHAEVNSFLFYRDFMEYHNTRFEDYSLMIFQNHKLVAVIPANIDPKGCFHSHEGLSYGGVLFKKYAYFKTRLGVYTSIFNFLFDAGIGDVFIKSIPRCYGFESSDHLFFKWLSTSLIRTEIYSYIPVGTYVKPNRGRLESVKKGFDLNLKLKEAENFTPFWNQILIPNLKNRYLVNPVHTVEEIKKLHNLFPDKIKLFEVYQDNRLRAGVVLFIHDKTVHTQYIASDIDRDDGSLDYLIDQVIKKYNSTKTFSFGTSSESHGELLNSGLLYWKESFRSVNDVQQFYHIKTKNYTALQNRLR